MCDLFNCIDKTDSYVEFQFFGVKGQNQKGIDIFSQRTKTVIQCKLKDTRKKDDAIRNKLMEDIEADLVKAADLTFKFERMIFASIFRDDAIIQEYLNQIKDERDYQFSIYYWGWDTLSNYAESYDDLLKNTFHNFVRNLLNQNFPKVR